MPAAMETNAVAARFRNSEEDITLVREQRAAKAQQQEAVQAAPALAQLVKAGGPPQ